MEAACSSLGIINPLPASSRVCMELEVLWEGGGAPTIIEYKKGS